MKWLFGLFVVLAALAGLAWYFVLDGATPARAEGVFDLPAYRALVALDAPEALPTGVNVEFVGESEAPSIAAEAGDFGGPRIFTYASFQIVAPDGGLVIDGAVDADALTAMTDGKGHFDAASYQRVLDAMTRANQVMITHEHPDHIIAVARHPEPAALAQRLYLSRIQLDALPQYAPNQVLAPEIANAPPAQLDIPRRIAPGIVAAPAPGHSPGSIVIFVKTATREFLFVGDIAWVMSNIERAWGRPRAIRMIMPGVDPDRPAVLRQIRALHDLAAAEPDLAIVPAHDTPYLHGLVEQSVISPGFTRVPAPPPLDPAPGASQPNP